MPASETPTNPTPVDLDEPGKYSSTPPPPFPQRLPGAFIAENDSRESVQPARAIDEAADEPEDVTGRRERTGSRAGYSTSRFVDYDSHELLEKISQYEDERRWQRIREGIWISIIAHILLFTGLYMVPRYVFHQTQVIDPFDAIKARKDLTYLDELPDALKQIQKAKPKLPPLKASDTVVDKKTLESLKALEKPKPAPPMPEVKQPQPSDQPVVQPQQQVESPAPPSVAAPQPNPQIALDTPRPAPVPARPSFSISHESASDQLRDAMRGTAQGQGTSVNLPPSHLNLHPSSGTGGIEVLSDTMGVNFNNWLQRWHQETQTTWDPLIPEETNPPISKSGVTVIRFKVLPNGRVMGGSMVLEGGTTADTALSRAAWGAITGSNYPPLPRDFHGPYLELRAYFLYNMGGNGRQSR